MKQILYNLFYLTPRKIWSREQKSKNRKLYYFLSIFILNVLLISISFNSFSQDLTDLTVTGVDSIVSGGSVLTENVTIPAYNNGTEHYYKISSIMQLRALSKLVMGGTTHYEGVTFKMTKDITITSEYDVYPAASGSAFDEASNFVPIGGWTSNTASESSTVSKFFSGIFDGQGHKIFNLKIKCTTDNASSNSYYVGLFGCVKGGTTNAQIKNLGIDNAQMSGAQYTGAIVGLNEDCIISNCFVTNSTITGNNYAGVLCGSNNVRATNAPEIKNSYVTKSSASGVSYIGGLCGANIGGKITNCYSTATVGATGTTNTTFGGLFGGNTASTTPATTPIITNSYYRDSWKQATVTQSLTENSTTAGCTSKTTTEMTADAFLTSINASTTNFIKAPFYYEENSYYPVLSWQRDSIVVTTKLRTANSANPYLIKTIQDLKDLSEFVRTETNFSYNANTKKTYNVYFKLNNDITFSSSDTYTNSSDVFYNSNFIPIGGWHGTVTSIVSNQTVFFAGNFDGDNHSITGLIINKSIATGNDYIGLFGYVKGDNANTEIKNLTLVTATNKGNNYVGGLIGYKETANVTNCKDTNCTITGNLYIGGLIGYNSALNIENCSSINANLLNNNNTTNCVGGLIGYNSGIISKCNTQNSVIKGGRCVGGLLGESNASEIRNSFVNFTTVKGDKSVGGLSGYASNNGAFKNCYATNMYGRDSISGSDSVGGLFGYISGSLYNVYAACDVKVGTTGTIGTYFGGLFGINKSTEFLADKAYYLSTWNCSNVAGITENSTTNANCVSKTIEELRSDGLLTLLNTRGTNNQQTIDFIKSPFYYNGGYPILDYQTTLPKNLKQNTVDNPYTIYTIQDLRDLSSYVMSDETYNAGTYGRYFKLMKNITFDDVDKIYNLDGAEGNESNLIPIGGYSDANTLSSSRIFQGYFDGGNHTITNLTIKRSTTTATYPSEVGVGLFGKAGGYNVKISNLNISNATIEGYQNVGAIAGYDDGNSLENCVVSGSTIRANQYAGGMVGYVGALNTTSCHTTSCFVVANTYAGGLYGYGSSIYHNIFEKSYVENPTITATNSCAGGLVGWALAQPQGCYVTGGTITGDNSVGGLFGELASAGSAIYIYHCYASTTVKGNDKVGGLVGRTYSVAFKDCYSTSTIQQNTSSTANFGGLFGTLEGSTYSINSYYIDSWKDVSVTATNIIECSTRLQGCYSKTASEMKADCFIPKINMDGNYYQRKDNTNNYYPVLIVNGNGINNNTITCVALDASVNNITSSSATVLARLKSYTTSTTLTRKIYYREKTYNNANTYTVITLDHTDPTINDTSYKATLSSLTASTTYEVYAELTKDGTPYQSDVISFTTPFNGSGTEADPYQIANVKDLRALSTFVMNGKTYYGQYFKVTSDIAFTSADNIYDFDNNAAYESNFIPIGGWLDATTNSTERYFDGIFNGNDKKITGIIINKSATTTINNDYVGLFGYIKTSSCKINNLTIERANISGYNNVGAVYGFHEEVGVPYRSLSSINSNIKGYDNVGGIAGTCGNILYNCFTNKDTIHGHDNVGGLCGNYSYIYSSMDTCYVTWDSISGNNYIGGIAGQAGYRLMRSYASHSMITGNNNIGGLLGQGSLSYCYTDIDTVRGNSYVGGLIGYASNPTTYAYAKDCHIYGKSYTGGILGNNIVSNNIYSTSIVERYADEGQTNTATTFGAITSDIINGTRDNLYYKSNWNSQGLTNNGSGTSKTELEMKDISFTDTMNNGETLSSLTNQLPFKSIPFYETNQTLNDNYPLLYWQTTVPQALTTNTETTPYQIKTIQDLKDLSTYVRKGYSTSNIYFKLMNDIKFTKSYLATNGTYDSNNFLPIGGWEYQNSNGNITITSSTTNSFQGTFDGNNHIITGLRMKRTSTSNNNNEIGLFGYNTGVIKNLGIDSSSIKGTDYVGLLCANNTGSIYNCYSAFSSVVGNAYVGGLVGANNASGSAIHNSYTAFDTVMATNTTSTTVETGGLCGYNVGDINNSYAASLVVKAEGVTATDFGGLVGSNNDGDGGNIDNNSYYISTWNTQSLTTTYGASKTPTELKEAISDLNTGATDIGNNSVTPFIHDIIFGRNVYPVLNGFTAKINNKYVIDSLETITLENNYDAGIPSALTIKDGGSLVDKTTSNVFTNTIIEKKFRSNAWNFIGTPIGTIQAKNYVHYNTTTHTYGNSKGYEMAIVKYDYTVNNWQNGNNMTYLGYNSNVEQGNGYLAYPFASEGIEHDMTIQYDTGTLIKSDIDLTINNSGQNNSGYWYSLSNPYPGNMYADKFLGGNSGVQGTAIYTYNNIDGSWNTISDRASYAKIGEGFFVAYATGGEKTIHLKNSYLEQTPSAKTLIPKMTITATANNLSKEAWIKFDDSASNGFDIQDAYKMIGDNELMAEPYFLVDSNNIVINSINTTPYQCPMNIHIVQASDVVLRFDDIPNNVNAYLIDNGVQTPLTNGTEYATTLQGGENNNRFAIRFASSSIEDYSIDEVSVSVWTNYNTITINGKNLQELSIYNVLGQQMYKKKLSGDTYKNTLTLASGTYTAKVKAGDKIKVIKFVIEK